MFRNHYYCLIAGLPDLILNEVRRGTSGLQFRDEMAELLHKSDFNLLKIIYLPYDNQNLINLLFHPGSLPDPHGNYSQSELESWIDDPAATKNYIGNFLKELKSGEPGELGTERENKLYQLFYAEIEKVNNGFIRQWFWFDRNLRNILTAANCKRFSYPVGKNLVAGAGNESLIGLLTKGNFNPEAYADEDIPYIRQILQVAESNLTAEGKEKMIDSIRWEYLDELNVFNYFSIEKIMSYAIRLNIIDRWQRLDAKSGREFLEKMIGELETGFTISET